MRQMTLLSTTKPKRPLLKYYGSGWQRAAWIVEHFPAHEVYCEPCFGAGAVLLHKRTSKREIVNDIDGRVMNFHEVLRTQSEELIQQIWLTPWHEGEYQRCLQPDSDPLEDARRFFFICWASIKGGPIPSASDFRWQKKADRRSSYVNDIRNIAHLRQAAVRLGKVQFLQRDALKVIKRMQKTNALIYFDPPYLRQTRARKTNGYRHEVTDEWHAKAAALLNQHNGFVVVSGYPSALYTELYEAKGWQRVERPSRTNSGGRATECIWVNTAVCQALGM